MPTSHLTFAMVLLLAGCVTSPVGTVGRQAAAEQFSQQFSQQGRPACV
ncbi:MAG: hypothetical protein NWS69_07375 [Pseudomonadales bacterium]|jgi:starvation-inducible outer membrane lipoprotein|nr:hypothetical protein [Pseudomonadales bacterium]MDP5059218.1 hypothetical protein [Pseudomonadales bacterium]